MNWFVQYFLSPGCTRSTRACPTRYSSSNAPGDAAVTQSTSIPSSASHVRQLRPRFDRSRHAGPTSSRDDAPGSDNCTSYWNATTRTRTNGQRHVTSHSTALFPIDYSWSGNTRFYLCQWFIASAFNNVILEKKLKTINVTKFNDIKCIPFILILNHEGCKCKWLWYLKVLFQFSNN